MNILEKDKESLKKARQNESWAYDETCRLENAIEFGRCSKCEEPLSHGDKDGHCGDFPECESPTIEMEKPIGDFIIKNAKGITTPSGVYYHYSEVCKLLNLLKNKI